MASQGLSSQSPSLSLELSCLRTASDLRAVDQCTVSIPPFRTAWLVNVPVRELRLFAHRCATGLVGTQTVTCAHC
jgi:hypothetical protein